MIGLLLIPVTAFGLLLQRPPPLGALRPEPRAALPRSVPHMIAPLGSSYPLRGTPLDDQVSPLSKFGTLLATNAIATVSPLAAVFIGYVLISRGKVEPDDDAQELAGTVGTILRKLIKPTGDTNWRQMGYTTCKSYNYTKNYHWDDRGSVDVSGCPKIFDGELNDLTMGYVFSAGKILRVQLVLVLRRYKQRAIDAPCGCGKAPARSGASAHGGEGRARVRYALHVDELGRNGRRVAARVVITPGHDATVGGDGDECPSVSVDGDSAAQQRRLGR